MTKSEKAGKPSNDQISALADKRIKELLKTHGPDVSEEVVLEGFRDWVLPDRHLAIIRERLERWRKVASKRASRKE
jgi:hypothetical protein